MSTNLTVAWLQLILLAESLQLNDWDLGAPMGDSDWTDRDAPFSILWE